VREKLTSLCFDEAPAILRTVALILGVAGYDVLTAGDSEHALLKLAGRHVDLVLLEAVPEAKLVAERARGGDPNVAMLLCTGKVDETDAPWADMILYKPVPPAELLRAISSLLKHKYEEAA
jgi:DNA-binding response OmpR family regulator